MFCSVVLIILLRCYNYESHDRLKLQQIYLKRKIPFELSSIRLTENGYTPEFEAEVLAEAEELYAAVANGTAKTYKNAVELRAALDAEDEDE